MTTLLDYRRFSKKIVNQVNYLLIQISSLLNSYVVGNKSIILITLNLMIFLFSILLYFVLYYSTIIYIIRLTTLLPLPVSKK